MFNIFKFFGEPLKEIKSKASGLTLFRFDTNGSFITDDQEIIKRALGFFDYIELKAETVGDRVKKTITVPQMTITTKEEKEIKADIIDEIKEVKIYKCKNCDFETDNKGLLLAHYREHKKEE